MTLQQSLEKVRTSRRRVQLPHFRGLVTDLIDAPMGSKLPRPQAFLVEQDPHWTLPTHFHQEHQFQLFVGGKGSMGRHRLPPLAVHYASPHSAYGPLISDATGIAYLTLRAVSDRGAWVLPDKRADLLTRIAKQQIHAAPGHAMDTTALRQLRAPELETLIAAQAGGPGAWVLRLPPHAHGMAPAPSPASAGRFHVITQGGIRSSQSPLEALAVLWTDPAEEAPMQAGPNGAEVVIMEFPEQAARSFVDDMNLRAAPY
jgi:hypothetical protein